MNHVEVNFVKRQTGEVDAIISKTAVPEVAKKSSSKTEIKKKGVSDIQSSLNVEKWNDVCGQYLIYNSSDILGLTS